ncbi:OmpA family protein [Ramlibacter albus]|uniref:OmpA family protein n=1 Tax=Ramlibacter albus TaxID=2079448 RepID=A0A923M888_9BURK|nr:OmpA family protein [Ramlibacter albus]MBC5764589.1 OmpA family protein [Ramlibacter albus]
MAGGTRVLNLLACAVLACGASAATAADVETRDLVESLTPRQRPLTRSIAAPSRNLVPERASVSLQIHFDFDSAKVSPESTSQLEKLAEALASDQLRNYRFALEGHTDAKGRADYNQRLSERRAEAVRAVLMQRGVDGARLVASGKGASEPANPADPLAAENRRVRVVNLE